MTDSKLIEMLRTFSPDELKRFRDLLSSPFYNKKTAVIKLYKNILKYAPGFNHRGLDKKKIFGELYPAKKYNDKIMRNLMTDLVRLGELFLEILYYENQKAERYYNLLNELLLKRLDHNFEKNFKLAKDFSKTLSASEHNYYNILQLTSLKHDYESMKNPKLEKKSDSRMLLDPLFCMFSLFFFKLNCNLATRNEDYNYTYDFSIELKFINSLMEYINQKSLESEPIIQIYYNLFMLIRNTVDESYFKKLRTLLNQHKELFDKRERYNFHTAMTTFCNRRNATGDISYSQFGLEVYKEMLSEKTYSKDKNDALMPLVFKNIVKMALNAKEFDWAKDFIELYKNKLTNGYDKNIYNFTNALLHYKKKDFENSLELLSNVHYENVYDKIDVKDLLIQLYYDLNCYEHILSEIDAYRHFLQNDNLLSNKIKNVHMNFIRFVRELSGYKFDNYDRYPLDTLEKELVTTITYDKNWLIEKVNELKDR